MQRTITLKANGTYTETVSSSGGFGRGSGKPATVFAVMSAVAPFAVELDNGGRQTVQAGMKITGSFKRLVLAELNGAENLITFYAGNDDITVPQPVTVESSAAQAVSPTEGIVLIAVNDTIQQLSASNVYISEIRLFPAKGVAVGVLTANTLGDIYFGRSATYLPDKRAMTDTDYPVIYQVPTGKKFLLSSIRIKGKAGDGVFYSYIPA